MSCSLKSVTKTNFMINKFIYVFPFQINEVLLSTAFETRKFIRIIRCILRLAYKLLTNEKFTIVIAVIITRSIYSHLIFSHLPLCLHNHRVSALRKPLMLSDPVLGGHSLCKYISINKLKLNAEWVTCIEQQLLADRNPLVQVPCPVQMDHSDTYDALHRSNAIRLKYKIDYLNV
jgi:hypothetical protein